MALVFNISFSLKQVSYNWISKAISSESSLYIKVNGISLCINGSNVITLGVISIAIGAESMKYDKKDKTKPYNLKLNITSNVYVSALIFFW